MVPLVGACLRRIATRCTAVRSADIETRNRSVVRQPEAQKSGRKATDLAVPQLVLPADVAKRLAKGFG